MRQAAFIRRGLYRVRFDLAIHLHQQLVKLLFAVKALHRLLRHAERLSHMLLRCFFVFMLFSALQNILIRRDKLPAVCLLRLCALAHGHGRVVDREVKFRHSRALALGAFDLFLRHVIHDHLCRVGMLALRLFIRNARTLADGSDDAADGHVQAGNELHQQRTKQQDDRTDAADDCGKRLRQQAGEQASARPGNAAAPKLARDSCAPCHIAAGENMHQRADGHSQQKRARHAQCNRPSVMQKQDHKAHQERERQDVKACAEQPLEKPRHQIQDHRIHTEAAEDREHAEKQAYARADLAPDRARSRFLPLTAARAALLRGGLGRGRILLSFLFRHIFTSRHK